MLRQVFRNWFTGTDNRSFEIGRAMWALSVLMGLIYQGIAILLKGQPFSVTDFGVGMGTLLAAGGVGVAAKDLANPANRAAKAAPPPTQEAGE